MTAHNHMTRDIKQVGQCPGCDAYWRIHVPTGMQIRDENARYEQAKAEAAVADLLAAANSDAEGQALVQAIHDRKKASNGSS